MSLQRFVVQANHGKKKVKGAKPVIKYYSFPFSSQAAAKRWIKTQNKGCKHEFGIVKGMFALAPQVPVHRAIKCEEEQKLRFFRHFRPIDQK
jgi:hypothetical protein